MKARSISLPLAELAPAARARLAEAISGQLEVSLLHSARRERPSLPAVAAIMGGVLGLVIVATSGYGAARGSEALQSPVYILGYALACAVLLRGVAAVWELGRQHGRGLPLGRFVFGAEVIDIDERHLHVIPLVDVTGIDTEDQELGGVYSHTDVTATFARAPEQTFAVRGVGAARTLRSDMLAACSATREALAERDRDRLQRLMVLPPHMLLTPADPQVVEEGPFRTNAMPDDPPSDTSEAARQAPIGWLALVIGACVLGGLSWHGRNHASDRSSFDKAQRRGTEEAFQAYLTGNGRFSTSVREYHLPEARWRRVEKNPTVGVLSDYIAENPDAPWAPAARERLDAMRERMRVGFQQRSADHPALQRYGLRLLQLLESGPLMIRVRFQEPDVAVFQQIEQRLQVRAERSVLPEDPPRVPFQAGIHERRVTAALSSQLRRCLGTTGLSVEHGGRQATGRADGPAVSADRPSIDVHYAFVASGTDYLEAGRPEFELSRPASSYTGLSLQMALHLRTDRPGDALRLAFQVELPADFGVKTLAILAPGSTAHGDARVYGKMLELLFTDLAGALERALQCPAPAQ